MISIIKSNFTNVVGDEAVQRLLDKGVMKSWMQGGIQFCSYQQYMVEHKDFAKAEVDIERVKLLRTDIVLQTLSC